MMALTQEKFADFSLCPHIGELFSEFAQLPNLIKGSCTDEESNKITIKSFGIIQDISFLYKIKDEYNKIETTGSNLIENFSPKTENDPLDLGDINIEIQEKFKTYIDKSYETIKDLRILLSIMYRESAGNKEINEIFTRIYGKESEEKKYLDKNLDRFLKFIEIRRLKTHDELKINRLCILPNKKLQLPGIEIKGKQINIKDYIEGTTNNIERFVEKLIIIGYNHMIPNNLNISKNEDNKYICTFKRPK